MKFLGTASREGFEIIMRGKSLDLPTKGNYVAPSICLANEVSLEQTKKSIYQQTEIFAPNVAIVAVSELSEATAQANATQYGLVSSIFTENRDVYLKCKDDLEMGLIYWNKPTTLTSPRLPFGGLKKSGNYFPIGVMSSLNCTVPVSCLESEQILSSPGSQNQMPGLNWTSSRKKD
jgi:succinylglutamic semialdehyde dehydrogenase